MSCEPSGLLATRKVAIVVVVSGVYRARACTGSATTSDVGVGGAILLSPPQRARPLRPRLPPRPVLAHPARVHVDVHSRARGRGRGRVRGAGHAASVRGGVEARPRCAAGERWRRAASLLPHARRRARSAQAFPHYTSPPASVPFSPDLGCAAARFFGWRSPVGLQPLTPPLSQPHGSPPYSMKPLSSNELTCRSAPVAVSTKVIQPVGLSSAMATLPTCGSAPAKMGRSGTG